MNIRPKRIRRTRPAEPGRHTSAAVRQAKAAGDDTMIFRVPGLDGGPGAVVPPALPARPAGRQALAEAEGRARRIPSPGPRPSDALLRQVASGLRDLDVPPAAHLRAYGCDKTEPAVRSALRGLPAFAGAGTGPDGQPAAWINLGRLEGDGDLVLDESSTEWLDALIAASQDAIRALRRHRPAETRGDVA